MARSNFQRILRGALLGLGCAFASAAAWAAESPIGHLGQFSPPVHFRRQSELVWRDVVAQMPFFRFDAIRSEANGNARIKLANGGTLDIEPDTLVILNPGTVKVSLLTESSEGTSDRAVVRSGKVQGRTDGELLLLTSAALVRLRRKTGAAFANATVTVREGRKMKVEILDGEGELLPTRSPGQLSGVTPTRLIPGKPVVLDAPVAEESFGTRDSRIEWPAAGEELQPDAPDIVVTSPADRAVISGSSATFTGHVSRPGLELRINGEKIPLSAKLEFIVSIPLEVGANRVLIQLLSDHGKVFEQRRTLIRTQ